MDVKEFITWMLILGRQLGECLQCFECDNKVNPACGVEFKSYQFQARQCKGDLVKCGLQRQKPQPEKDNFIGILRRCYHLGSIPDINETDGCHTKPVPPYNFTFELCFCSEDYCNTSSSVTNGFLTLLLCISLLFVLKIFRR